MWFRLCDSVLDKASLAATSEVRLRLMGSRRDVRSDLDVNLLASRDEGDAKSRSRRLSPLATALRKTSEVAISQPEALER